MAWVAKTMTLDFSHWRKHFPITRHFAYLDHASLGPLPTEALDAMHGSLEIHAERGSTAYKELSDAAESSRVAFAHLIGADAADVCSAASTGAAFNIIANGFSWQRGDSVVVPAIEFPSICPYQKLRPDRYPGAMASF